MEFEPNFPTINEVLTGNTPRPFSLEDLRDFLRRNQCIRILRYLEEMKNYCDTYCTIYVQLGPLTGESWGRPEIDMLFNFWRNILSEFLLPGSPQEINLTEEEYQEISVHFKASRPPSPEVFDHITTRLFIQMKDRIFPSFLSRFDP